MPEESKKAEAEVVDGVYGAVLEMLRAGGHPFAIHEHSPVRTIEEAHERVPHLTRNLLKTVVFRIKDGDWVLASVPGEARIHYKKLAEAVGVNRKDLRSVDPETVSRELGFEVGGVGPFPVRDDVRVVLDEGLLHLDTIFCGSGRNTRTVEMAAGHLREVVGGKVFPVRR